MTRTDGAYELDQKIKTGRTTLGLLDDIERQEPSRPADSSSTAYLDGLRGVAALCVFTQHLIGGGPHEMGFGQESNHIFISLPFIRVFYNGGMAAVAVFFVLSGFVLSRTPVKICQAGAGQRTRWAKSMTSAVVRRPIRLYVPAILSTLIVALAMQLPGDIYPGMPWSHARDSLGAELVNWFGETFRFFNPFRRHGADRGFYQYNVVMWTIPLELQGSMVLYTLVSMWYFLPVRLWSSTGLLFLVAVISLQLGSYMIACFAAGFALSIIDVYALDADILRRLSPRSQKIALHSIFVVGYYLLSQPGVVGRLEWSLNTPGWRTLTRIAPKVYGTEEYFRYWHSYGAILLVYSCLRISWLQKLFNTRPLQYLGRVSYMLYLLHYPLFICLVNRTFRLFGEFGAGPKEHFWDSLLYVPNFGPRGLSTRWIVEWTTALAICLPIADLATRFVDQPCVRMAKRISQKLGLDERTSFTSKGETREMVP